MTVVGGGIAGLTAALRLVERGFDVEVFEKGPLMGGNLSGVKHGGAYYDVYPHMFAEWFHNFWKLTEDIGLEKHKHFERRRDCGFLAPGDFPHYRVCTDIGAFRTGLKNLSSGVISLPEMFLANYTILDAIARGDADKEFLENQTLNDFIVNRPYATRGVTHFFDSVVRNVWSIDSYLSSALAYQRFAKYQFREPSPLCWVLKGNSYENFVVPLLKALNSRANMHINTEVTGVTVGDGRVTRISYKHLKKGAEVDRDVDGLIIASSPASLGDLIFTPASKDRNNADAQSIVSLLPNLANVRRLGSDPLPVLYVTFKRKLAQIPSYYVALLNSKYSLTFVQIEELSGPKKTVLAVAASDFDALPVRLKEALANAIDDKGIMPTLSSQVKRELKDAAHPILKEFQRYVPFKLEEDIDWDKTFFQPNLDQKLFLNEVGSQRWTTEVSYPEINNLYFAGNSCANSIMIATVESAVYSGLQAAGAVVQRHRHLDAVSIIDPEAYPTPLLFAWKIMLAPYAALAKIWVEADTLLKDTMGMRPRPGALPGARAVSEIGRSLETAIIEWWKAADSFWRRSER
ncbi:MAG TPA: FAD-dependent oxidoreductase [Bradyrhizobium sp.]|nr:FAD-dependent oxidoreductase [Bradyrhizobium sp.]